MRKLLFIMVSLALAILPTWSHGVNLSYFSNGSYVDMTPGQEGLNLRATYHIAKLVCDICKCRNRGI